MIPGTGQTADEGVRRAVAVAVVALTAGVVGQLLTLATDTTTGSVVFSSTLRTAVVWLTITGYAAGAASGLYAVGRAVCRTRQLRG